MTVDIVKGFELLTEIVSILNKICRQDGGIETDDDRIWSQWIHQRTNEDWLNLLSAVQSLQDESPGSFYTADLQVFDRAQRELAKSISQNKDFVGRPKVRASGNKNTVWQAVMRTREVVNRYRGQTIPNRPPSIYGPPPQEPPSLDQFRELFKTE